jgi:hypothetical protein
MAAPIHVRFSVLFPALLGLLLAALTPLRAEPPTFKGNGEPLHPSAITTMREGKTLPVVGAAGEKAQVEVDGKVVDAPKDAVFTFVRMPSFGPGSVTVTSHEIVDAVKQTRSADGVPINELSDRDPTTEYHGTFVSDIALPDAFLVVLVFDKGFLAGTSPSPSTAVFFKQLGTLAAGKAKEVVVELGKFSAAAKEKMQFVPLVYTGGREVRTQLSELSAAYFRKQEMTRHQSIVASYVSKNADADKPLQPYVRVSPLLPPLPNAVSTKVNAGMIVADDGTVNEVNLQGDVPADIKKEVERALKAWLFLPQLAKGKAIVTKATVPLQIPLPPSAAPSAK